jgi:hypothetical protein
MTAFCTCGYYRKQNNSSSIINGKGKGKIVPVTATNNDMGSRGIAALILNVGCRWS